MTPANYGLALYMADWVMEEDGRVLYGEGLVPYSEGQSTKCNCFYYHRSSPEEAGHSHGSSQ